METQLYIVFHKHRFGAGVSLVESDHCPTVDEVVDKGIVEDFESDREDEWITIDTAPKIERI